MQNKLLDKVSQRRQEWLDLKKKTVGGSEIATVCGLNPYKTPLQLWAEKTGREVPQGETDSMWLGTKLQPVVAELWSRKTGKTVTDPDAVYGHAVHEWATATPDYLINDGGLLEIKTTAAQNKRQWETSTGPRPAYLQLQWQLGILREPHGFIAGLIGGQELLDIPALFDAALFEQLLQAAGAFIDCVKTDTPPQAVAEDLDLLQRLRQPEEITVPLPEAAATLFETYRSTSAEISAARKTLKELEARADTAKAQLVQMLGNASAGTWGPYGITVKTQARKGYVVEEKIVQKITITEGDI